MKTSYSNSTPSPNNKILLSALAAAGLAFGAGSAQAATVTVTPDAVNRVIGGSFTDTHFADAFSTHPSSTQRTLLFTSNATFEAALLADLGPLGAGESYQINSATLTVGSEGDPYTSNGGKNAHLVLVSYDTSDVTWNERDADLNIAWSTGGLAAGTDYGSSAVDTGVVDGSQTIWSGLGPSVADWLDGSVDNFGLFFPDTALSTGTGDETTNLANVVWTLDAQIIPEPSSLALLALGGLLIASRRRRA